SVGVPSGTSTVRLVNAPRGLAPEPAPDLAPEPMLVLTPEPAPEPTPEPGSALVPGPGPPSASALRAVGMVNSPTLIYHQCISVSALEDVMARVPERADIVVIGAGIVGNSLVRHLADQGWRDIVLLDKGPLPDPGGSTGHASNFVFPVDHSKQITQLTVDAMHQYEELDALITCGGIEVARTPERVQEFHRRMASATTWGVDAQLLEPSEIADLVPYCETSQLLAGFYTPSGAIVDPITAGEK